MPDGLLDSLGILLIYLLIFVAGIIFLVARLLTRIINIHNNSKQKLVVPQKLYVLLVIALVIILLLLWTPYQQ